MFVREGQAGAPAADVFSVSVWASAVALRLPPVLVRDWRCAFCTDLFEGCVPAAGCGGTGWVRAWASLPGPCAAKRAAHVAGVLWMAASLADCAVPAVLFGAMPATAPWLLILLDTVWARDV